MPEVRITKISANGEGIGFEGSSPILLYGALPGDLAEYRIIEKQSRVIRGQVKKIKEPSPFRIPSACGHSGACEGCPLITASYDAQLEWKRQEVADNLRKQCGIDPSIVEDVVPNDAPLGYRNLVKLPVMSDPKGGICNGMYHRGTNRLTPVYHCPIHEPGLEEVRLKVLEICNRYELKAYDRKLRTGLRGIYLRGMQQKYQLALCGGKDPYPEQMITDLMKIPGMNSIYQNIQTVRDPREMLGEQMIHLAGTKALSFKCGKIHLVLSLPSFYQMNTAAASKLYDLAVSMIPEGTKNLVEAYCGIGAISLLAAGKAEKITAVEYAGSSIRDAKEALKRNPVNNIEFIRGDAGEQMKKIARKEKIDCLVVDPPRTGMDDAMIEAVQKSSPSTIIYISCNPYTLAKNLSQLKKYKVKRVVPVDIFSQTPHVETVVMMTKK